MLKRHEVEILLKAGHPKTEVTRLSGVSLRSVKRIAEESAVVHVDDARERGKRKIGRPSTVANFRKQVIAILQETPDLAAWGCKCVSGNRLSRRKDSALWAGGLASLETGEALVRFEGLPGEFSQHDFGQVEVEFRNGASQRIHFFASRLKYSRLVRVNLVPDDAVESLVRTLADHLASWGGRPLLCVFDRPKTIALKWRTNGEVTEWNPIFAYATLEMGVGVELCWPYRAQQKGSVENLVGFVKSSFFKVRRFHDEEDLRQQLRDWHREVNQERPCRATGIIPAMRLAEEAPRLRTLKVQPEQLALRIPVYVGPTGTVLHDGHAYSMPPEAISMPATLYLYGQRSPKVFCAGEFFVAGAPRGDGRGGIGETRQALSETAAVVGAGRAGDSLSHGDRASPTPAVVRGCRSAAPASAEPRPGSSAACHGRRPEAADIWSLLCGEISPTRVELSAGGAMKTDKRGMLWVDGVGDRRSQVILAQHFSGQTGDGNKTRRNGQ